MKVQRSALSFAIVFGCLLILFYTFFTPSEILNSFGSIVLSNTLYQTTNQEYTIRNQNVGNVTDILLVLNNSSVKSNNIKSSNNNQSFTFKTLPTNLSLCSSTPPNLVGSITVWMDEIPISKIESLYPGLENGGHGWPLNCRSRHRVAIIIPFR